MPIGGPPGLGYGVQATVHPEYPTRSRCWLCGRFASGSRGHALRKCPHCDVTWCDPFVNAPPADPGLVERSRARGLEDIKAKYGFRADEDFIDHAANPTPCPA